MLTACFHIENTGPHKRISGEYEVTAITSDAAFDMNNDGKKSDDLFKEISDEHNTIDGQSISFYSFNSFDSFLKLNQDVVAFSIPDQYIDELSNGTPFLSSYLNKVYAYKYDYDRSTKTISVIYYNNDVPDDNIVLSIEIVSDEELRLRMSKLIFDFVDKEWSEAALTILYRKVQ